MTSIEEKQAELKQLMIDNRIRTENRRISCITCEGSFYLDNLHFTVYLDPLDEAPYWHNEIHFDAKELHTLLKVFKPDFVEHNSSEDKLYGFSHKAGDWTLDDFSGKYVRLLWQITAPEDMHELANEEDLFAIKHIVNDDDNSIFFL